MMTKTAISIKNLSKMYKLYDRPVDRLKESLHPFKKEYHRPFYALKNIALEVERGEVLGVVGRNGAGKSTLLSIISGVLTPTSGQCRVNGRISPLLSLATGFNPELTGIENIYLNGTLKGYSKKEMDGKRDEILDFADIGRFIEQPLKIYSSGMKARLAFALAVNVDPEILIVDEVLAVGDDLFKRKCYARMEQLFHSGCTVLFVSHSTGQVNDICTRVILVDNGEILLDGPPLLVTRYYHKLIYALGKNQEETRAEIIDLNQNRDKKKDFARDIDVLVDDMPEKSERTAKSAKKNKSGEEDSPIAYYIPDFIPRSMVRQFEHPVEISDEQIQTVAGKKVNALVMNDVYVFSYKVTLPFDAADTRFAFLVQTEKGQSLAGFTLDLQEDSLAKTMTAGDTYLVQTRFKCALLPGIYYISISVYHLDDKMEKVFLARINDLLVFKVQENTDTHHWGIVNLGQSGKIAKLT